MQLLRYTHIALLLLSFMVPAYSARLADDIEPGDGVNEIQLPLTKESAAELIRVESGGKILAVDEHKHKNKIIFKIKVLHSNGKVKYHYIDPMTAHPPK